ncbi:hypothetical protein Leryth_015778 [Lithospermum erythrorhizon]|nr:hypothetical protein Leryth_015778 [Lithospermum erythrorhizon]
MSHARNSVQLNSEPHYAKKNSKKSVASIKHCLSIARIIILTEITRTMMDLKQGKECPESEQQC